MPLSVLHRKDFSEIPRFQLWTDALCFRQMAQQAANNYLRSMCVRNAILSAWTTLEMGCCDALGIQKLGTDFARSLNSELDNVQIPRLDFSSGLWQQINDKVKGYRKRFAMQAQASQTGSPPPRLPMRRLKRFGTRSVTFMHMSGSGNQAG
jgi:hypothetical protein